MAYGDFKGLNRKTFADKALLDKAFNIANDSKWDRYWGGLASMVYKFLDKKTSGSGIKNKSIPNERLAEELHKPFIRIFKKRKLPSPFIGNI